MWVGIESSACHVLFHIHSPRVTLDAVSSPCHHTQHLSSHIKTEIEIYPPTIAVSTDINLWAMLWWS